MARPNPNDFRVLPPNDEDLIPLYIGSDVSKPFWIKWGAIKKILTPTIPSGSAAWGSILPGTGVDSQEDLIEYLDDNYYPLSDNPSGYITASELATALLPYVTDSELTAILSNYVTDSELSTALSDYVTNAELTSALAAYVTNTDLTTALAAYTPTFLYKNTTNQTAVTGTIANTRVLGVLIPAGKLPVGSIMTIKARVGKTGTAGVTTLRIYANTADNITSPAPTLLMTIATGAATQIYLGCDRTAVVKSLTVTQTAQANTTIPSDAVVGNATLTNSNINTTVDQYIQFAIQNAANGDSTVLSYVEIEIK